MLRRHSVLLLLVVALAGCGDGFPDEEMHLGIEDKVRPYAVTVEPPDVAPGETVTVTFLGQAPDPDEVDIAWRVAQDYFRGPYGADEVERRYADLAAPLPVDDADGFMIQTFTWTVPDSIHLWSSAIPAVLTDATMIALVEQLVGPAAGSPPRKAAVDAWLKALTPADLAAMDPLEAQAALALADRFACQVRFRARLRTGITVDVTRNLTVRHTRRLDGPNTNENARVVEFGLVALDKRDAKPKDIDDPGVERTWYRFVDGGSRVADRVDVPLHGDWTYFTAVRFAPELFTSPYDFTGLIPESGSYRWYYYRQDSPRSGHHFFVNEDGEDTEMWELDEEARVKPAGVGSRFRIVSVVRDERPDWELYHATHGGTTVEGVVEFVAP
ncbi:MAG: hypothetical protein GY838_03180 [bacterium]|nr:hypothetical protein [bacterium]